MSLVPTDLRSCSVLGRLAFPGVAAVLVAVMALDCVVVQAISGEVVSSNLYRWGLSTVLPLAATTIAARHLRLDAPKLFALAAVALTTIISADLAVFPVSADYGLEVVDRLRTKAPVVVVFLLIGMKWRSTASDVGRTPARFDPNLASLLRCDVVQAAGNYVQVRTDSGTELIRYTLSDAARQLAPYGFIRIHRSWLVQADSVVELRRNRHGLVAVRLRSGEQVPVGRKYRTLVYDIRPSRASRSSQNT